MAQLYLTEDHANTDRPAQELNRFARVVLAPGETRHVTISLDAHFFAWYDVAAKAWQADAGSYTVHVGRASADP